MACRSLYFVLLFVLSTLSVTNLHAQYRTKKVPVSPTLIIDQTDLIYDLLESFELVRKANDGDARAQHELGIRYFIGRGFQADTAKAFLWISRAADQGLVRAHYNMGVFYNNGWGAPWNPFKGYRHFRVAAERNMPEAEYTVGLLLTENLVVPRDLDEAERWLRKASDQGLDVAKTALRDLQQRRADDERRAQADTSSGIARAPQDTSQSKVPPFMFLDAQPDTLSDIQSAEDLEQLFSNRGPQLMKALGIPEEAIDTTKPAPAAEKLIETTANVGSPEARIVLGRCYELGRGCPLDVLRAAVYYLSAIRLDSPKAAQFLWELVHRSDLSALAERRAKAGSNDARFVLSGLAALQFDFRITEEQSAQLLDLASREHHIESLLELGVRYSSGRTVPQNRQKALELWRIASSLGSREADVRLAAAELFGPPDEIRPGLLNQLMAYAQEGSSLAEVALAYCYETGTGVQANTAHAAKYYRRAASRGSESAYIALRALYDEIRPADKEFQVSEF